jgi:hypothetical protein
METNKSFDVLIVLLKKAQGDRSLNQFAKDCSVNAGHLSRILNKKFIGPPSPDFLWRISEHAENNVTYEVLMDAAGHTKNIRKEISEAESLSLKEIKEKKEKEKKEEEKDIEIRFARFMEELEQTQGLMLSGKPISPDAVKSILGALEYGIQQAKVINKMYSPKKTKDK